MDARLEWPIDERKVMEESPGMAYRRWDNACSASTGFVYY